MLDVVRRDIQGHRNPQLPDYRQGHRINPLPGIVHRDDRSARWKSVPIQRLDCRAQPHYRKPVAPQILDPAKKQLFSNEQPTSKFVLLCDCEAVITYDAQTVAGDVSRDAEQPKQFYDRQRRSEDCGRDRRLGREPAEAIRYRPPKPNRVESHPSPDCRQKTCVVRTHCLGLTDSAGADAKQEVIVIHNEQSSVNTTNGVSGSRFFSVDDNTHEMPVRITMI